MDWSKAKNILILAFLALNIFLGYSLWKEAYLLFPSRVVTYQEIEKAEQKLDSINLELKASIPRQIYFMSFLTVSNKTYEGEDLAGILFSEEYSIDRSNEEEGFVVFQEGKNELAIWDKGKVVFTREPFSSIEDETQEMEEEEAASVAEEFLQEFGLFPFEARLEEVVAFEDGRYFLLYNQVYKNQALFGSYLKVWVHPNGVEGFELYWLKPEGFSGEDISTVSAASALLNLSEVISESEEKKVVESISIGYYSEAFDAQKWDTVPVWRIKITGRGIYFINAYTGELEGKDENNF